MDVFRKFAVTTDEAWLGVEAELGLGLHPLLAGKPLAVVGQETLVANGKLVALIDLLDPVGNVEPEELANVGALQGGARPPSY